MLQWKAIFHILNLSSSSSPSECRGKMKSQMMEVLENSKQEPSLSENKVYTHHRTMLTTLSCFSFYSLLIVCDALSLTYCSTTTWGGLKTEYAVYKIDHGRFKIGDCFFECRKIHEILMNFLSILCVSNTILNFQYRWSNQFDWFYHDFVVLSFLDRLSSRYPIHI